MTFRYIDTSEARILQVSCQLGRAWIAGGDSVPLLIAWHAAVPAGKSL